MTGPEILQVVLIILIVLLILALIAAGVALWLVRSIRTVVQPDPGEGGREPEPEGRDTGDTGRQ